MSTSGSSPRPRRKSDQTRADLLRSAREIFSRDGLINARISDIVEHAGKSSGLFYNYYENKRDLFAALVGDFNKDLLRNAPDPAKYANDPATLVRETVRSLWVMYKAHRGDVKGLFEVALTDEELRSEWQKLRQVGIRSFAYRVAKQQELGYCKGMDAKLAGSALLGMFEFGFFNWEVCRLDFPEADVPDEEAIETVVALLQNAMQLSAR